MKTIKSASDKILEEHRELRGLLGDLKSFVEKPRPKLGSVGTHTWASQLASRIVTIHDKVYRHFREEGIRVLDDLITANPRAVNAVEGLKREHEEILSGFRTILPSVMAFSESRQPEIEHPRQKTLEVIEKLQQHEAKETDLIQRLAYEDLGIGD